MEASQSERDYVLGTHDEELWRLGLQHLVWKSRAFDAWSRAGFTIGQTLIDVGCGPGYAALDLAEIVGPSGRIFALERSGRFLTALESIKITRGLTQISTTEMDLDTDELPALNADGAWVRWVFSFVTKPGDLLRRIAGALKPGGVLVIHEYFDYSTWRMAPRIPEVEEFVNAVMLSWRAAGGEPDIGLNLPGWLQDQRFELRSLRPYVDIVPPSSFIWQWPKAFLRSGIPRLVELGQISPEKGQQILESFTRAEANAHTLMITPAVLEIIAVRR